MFDLITFGSNLYVATSGSASIASWDTSDISPSWSSGNLSNFDADGQSLSVLGSSIYMGGGFTQFSDSGTVSANRIAQFDSALGSGSSLPAGTPNGVSGGGSSVLSMTSDAANNLLYVGGSFTTAAATTASNIAEWTPGTSTWSALTGTTTGNGVNSVVLALTTFSGDVYVGGSFSCTASGNSAPTCTGGIPAADIVKWDGTNWSSLSTGFMPGGVLALAVSPSLTLAPAAP